MPHSATFFRLIPAAVLLVLALGSAAGASQPESPSQSDEADDWPTAGQLRATLLRHGYEPHWDDASVFRSHSSGTTPESQGGWIQVDSPDDAPARVRLSLAEDTRVADLLEAGSMLSIPPLALDEASALVQNEVPMADGPGCTFEEWYFSGGRMVLWRDSTADDVGFVIAIEPPSPSGTMAKADEAIDAVPSSASEACGAAHQGTTAVAQATDEPPLTMVEVEARDLWFSPATLTVSSSERSTIRLTNAGRVVHNLTVDELELVIVVTRGGSGEVILTDVDPGTYAFYCSISGHREAGMEGTLTVQ